MVVPPSLTGLLRGKFKDGRIAKKSIDIHWSGRTASVTDLIGAVERIEVIAWCVSVQKVSRAVKLHYRRFARGDP